MILEEKEFFEISFEQYVSHGDIHKKYHKEIAHSSLPISQNQDFFQHVSFLSFETNEKEPTEVSKSMSFTYDLYDSLVELNSNNVFYE